MVRLPTLTSFLLLTSFTTLIKAYDSTACNNSPSLCDVPYSNITYLGTHNSAFLRDESTGFSSSGNQFFDVTTQLNSGVRLLQSQLHLQDGVPKLCHSSCRLLDAGTLEKWLTDIAEWMGRNPSEVVTILLVNGDNIPATDLAPIFDRTGLMQRTYKPTSRLNWPTIGEMISAQKNLVVFITGGFSELVPTFMDQFQYVFETPFETLSTFEWSCALDRPSSYANNLEGALEDGMLPLANRFVYKDLGLGILAPNVEGVGNANSRGSLGGSLEACVKGSWKGRRPSFVLVDFWSEGDTMEVVDTLNGVEDPVNRTPPPKRESVDSKENSAVGLQGEVNVKTAAMGMVVALLGAVVMF